MSTLAIDPPALIPTLRVASYARSRPFYEALGFVERWTHRFEPGFPVFVSMLRDGLELYLTEHTGDCAFGALVHVRIADVDALHALLRERGVEVAELPHSDIAPDLRMMGVVDPDGNRLRFVSTRVG